jgi:hypothetical protein
METAKMKILAFILLLFFGCPILAVLAARFQGLGDLPGGTVANYACGVSADGAVILSWPTNPSGFMLEQTLLLLSSNTWSTSSAPVHLVGGSFRVTNSPGAAPHFFRLRKP